MLQILLFTAMKKRIGYCFFIILSSLFSYIIALYTLKLLIINNNTVSGKRGDQTRDCFLPTPRVATL
jgi:hypothetical protein